MNKVILLMCLLVLVSGCIISEEELSNVGPNTINTDNVLKLGNLTYTNYSKIGYVQVIPKANNKLIVIECVNSTLVIDNNTLYCKRR